MIGDIPQGGGIVAVHGVRRVDGIRLKDGSQVCGESQQGKDHDEQIVGPPP